MVGWLIPHDQKGLRLFNREGTLVNEIDLNESGWRAHCRLLIELMKPVPDTLHTLSDAVAVSQLIDRARDIAQEEPDYSFGELPEFLK